jgi:hypothetical protein
VVKFGEANDFVVLKDMVLAVNFEAIAFGGHPEQGQAALDAFI